MKTYITTALFLCCAALIAKPADLKFDKVKADTTKIEGIQGRFKIVKVSKGNNALQVYSLNKKDNGQVKIPLGVPKENKSKFNISMDFRVMTKTTPAGRLVAITDWNTNEELVRLETTAGKLEIKGTDFANGKLQTAKICSYKPEQWMTLTLDFDIEAGKCKVVIKDKASGEKIYSGSHMINKKSNAVFAVSSTWPGQSKTGYAYDFDNIKVTTPKK